MCSICVMNTVSIWRKKKVLIECRMSKILERYGLDSFAGYLDMVHQDRSGEMAGEMVNHLTTNYTYFYREADHFERLQDAILPELLGHSVSGTLDIWCAGCSTGEECYTLGMTLEEYKRIQNVTLRAEFWLPISPGRSWTRPGTGNIR